MGKSAMTVTGTSTSVAKMPQYIDFYLLLDNSPSMGVGATPTDVAKMVKNTSDKCAFACHDLNDNNNYYKLAKAKGVKTRIDVLRSATEKLMITAADTQTYTGQYRMAIDVLRTATQQLMDTAAATQTYTSQFRMAIYDFGASAQTADLRALFALIRQLSDRQDRRRQHRPDDRQWPERQQRPWTPSTPSCFPRSTP